MIEPPTGDIRVQTRNVPVADSEGTRENKLLTDDAVNMSFVGIWAADARVAPRSIGAASCSLSSILMALGLARLCAPSRARGRRNLAGTWSQCAPTRTTAGPQTSA